MLPGLYRDSGLSESGGCWQLFPEEGLFKVTTAQGRSWFARYGLVASWNHDSHSWLWGWAIPPEGLNEPNPWGTRLYLLDLADWLALAPATYLESGLILAGGYATMLAGYAVATRHAAPTPLASDRPPPRAL